MTAQGFFNAAIPRGLEPFSAPASRWGAPGVGLSPTPVPADQGCGAVPNPFLSLSLLTTAVLGIGNSQPGFGKEQNTITVSAQIQFLVLLVAKKREKSNHPDRGERPWPRPEENQTH